MESIRTTIPFIIDVVVIWICFRRNPELLTKTNRSRQGKARIGTLQVRKRICTSGKEPKGQYKCGNLFRIMANSIIIYEKCKIGPWLSHLNFLKSNSTQKLMLINNRKADNQNTTLQQMCVYFSRVALRSIESLLIIKLIEYFRSVAIFTLESDLSNNWSALQNDCMLLNLPFWLKPTV